MSDKEIKYMGENSLNALIDNIKGLSDSKVNTTDPTTSGYATHDGDVDILGDVYSKDLFYLENEISGGAIQAVYKSVSKEIENVNDRIDDISFLSSGSNVLEGSVSGPILGIDALGKSWQSTTQILNTIQGSIDTNGKINTTEAVALQNRCLSAKEMYLHKGDVVSAGNGFYIFLCYSSTSDGDISERYVWDSSYTINKDGYWRVIVKKANDANLTPSDFTLVVTTTPTPTNPIPIKDASAEVVAETKNLFNPSNILNAHLNDDSYGVRVNDAARMVYAKCKPNTTYTVSKRSGQRFQVAYITDIPADGLPFYGKISNPTASSISITTGANAKYIVAFVWLSSADTISANDMLTSVQIEEGPTATSYVPYASNAITLPYTLRSVGEVKDELIVKADGTGKLIQRVEEVNLESFTWKWGWESAWYTDEITNGVASLRLETANIMAEQYLPGTQPYVTTVSGIGYLAYWQSSDTVNRCACNNGSSSEKPKGLMLYELATPIETPLTPEQVNYILSLKTYNPTTYIEHDLSALEVNYYTNSNAGEVIANLNSKVGNLEQLINSLDILDEEEF